MATQRAARDTGVIVIFRYVGAGISLATTAISARALGPRDFGLVALVLAYPTLVSSVVAVKSMSVTVRYLSHFRVNESFNELRSMCKIGYLTDVGASLSGFLLVGLTAPLVADHLLDVPPIAPWMILYSAALVAGSLVGTGRSIMIAFDRYRMWAIFQPFEKALSFCFVLAALALGGGMESVAMSMAAAVAVSGIASAMLSSHLLRDETGLGWWTSPMRRVMHLRKELLGSFGWTYATSTLAGALTQLPTLILGTVAGPREAGFLRLAVAATSQVAAVESSIWNISYPKLSRRWASEGPAGLRSLRGWTLHAGAPLAALGLVGMLVAPYLVRWIFGDQYEPMVGGLQIMMLGAATSLACFFVAPAYYAMGLFRQWAVHYGIYVMSAISLSFFFARTYGFEGVAIPLGVSNIIFNLLTLAYTVRLLRSQVQASSPSVG